VSAKAATVLIFADDRVVAASEPSERAAFEFQDSAEARRLFLQKLATFGDEPRLAEKDLLFAPIALSGRTFGVLALEVDREPPRERCVELAELCAVVARLLDAHDRETRAVQELQESSAFKDDLLAMLAHDFKSPLAVIIGYCELMMESGAEYSEELEMIYAQAGRLVRLSDDALVLARTQSEGFSLTRRVLDFGAYVATAVDECVPGGERISVDVPKQPVPVEIDSTRFRHVVDNLLSNALKYSSGAVEVSVRAERPHALLQVTDHGIGIPQDELSALFTRFGRASNARERGVAGSGVGLYIARKIVEANHGNISVSSHENEGSTFVVLLPLAGATP
jgi:signal transduction histidine kinase